MMLPARPLALTALLLCLPLLGGPAATAGESTTVTLAESAPGIPGDDASRRVTAIGLRQGELPALGPAEVVILVDTSASQTGVHRQRSLDAVSGILESARATDRLALAAVDVAVAPLSNGFLEPADEALRAAARGLDARTPLGSTDLVSAIEESIARFERDGPKRIIYIGDGPALNGVDPEAFAAVVDLLRSRQVSVSSLGLGPNVN